MKRVLCVVLAVVLSISLYLAVGAYSIIVVGYGSGSLEENFSLGDSNNFDFTSLEVEPGDEIRIPLTAGLFEWSDGREVLPNESIKSLFQLYNSRIKLSYTTLAGYDVLDYVQLEMGNFRGAGLVEYGTLRPTNRTAYISVSFIDDFADIRDKYFRYRLFLSIDGERPEELSIELTGEYKFDVDMVNSYTDGYDISQGEIIEAEETVPNIKLDLGSGVTLQKNLNQNTRYYGQAYLNDSVEDMREEWPELYPDVAIIYQIQHKNLDGGISKATLVPPDGKTYYVYNRNMEFVGMTGETVPFSDVFFLSTTEMPAFQQEKYQDLLVKEPTRQS